jgi:hypothetical protein
MKYSEHNFSEISLQIPSTLDTEIGLRHPRFFLSVYSDTPGTKEKEKKLGIAKISVMAGNLWGRS